MTRDQVNARLREEVVKSVSMQHQMEAMMKLYDSAAMMKSPLCETYRTQIHDLMDMLLDTKSTICSLTDVLIGLQD